MNLNNSELIDYYQMYTKTKSISIFLEKLNESISNEKKTPVKLYFEICKNFILKERYTEVIDLVQHILSNMNTELEYSDICKFYELLVNCYEKIKDIQNFCKYIFILEKLSYTNGDLEILEFVYVKISEYCKCFNIYEKFIQYQNKLLSLYKKQNKIEDTINILSNLVDYMVNTDRYDAASKQINNLLFIANKSNNLHAKWIAITYIGIIQNRLGKLKESKEFHERALEIAKNIEDYSKILRSMLNIGNIVRKNWELEEAEKIFIKIKKLAEDKKNILTENIFLYVISGVHTNLGDIALLLGNLDNARFHILESLKIDNKLGDYYGLENSYYSLANIYLIMNDYEKTIKYAKEGLNISEITGDKNLLYCFYNLIYRTNLTQLSYFQLKIN
ncbi:MAG: tetratricopeptide repeat protein [Clostridiales bacterium]